MIESLRSTRQRISEIIYEIQRSVYYFQIENYDKALRGSRKSMGYLSELLTILTSDAAGLKEYVENEQEYFISMLEGIERAQEIRDYVLLSDLYQQQLLVWLQNLQGVLMSIDSSEGAMSEEVFRQNMKVLESYSPMLCQKLLSYITDDFSMRCTNRDKEFELEDTSSGEQTLAVTVASGRYYLHSNLSPRFSAFLLAEHWYREEIRHYYIFGLGLGYHIVELLNKTPFVHVTVFEPDMEVICIAMHQNIWKDVLASGRLTIYHDADLTQMSMKLSELSEEEEAIVYAPSMIQLTKDRIRESLENYFIQYQSMKNQGGMLLGNFRKNIERQDASVEELKSLFLGKTVYIIAAGPSLDKNYALLKEVKNGIILATGTVFRKLLTEGIKPDYVIVTDANERVYGQIRGLESMQIPMLYLSTANYLFAKNYQGKKYIILQKGLQEAEVFATEHKYQVFETGGSVTTTALDVCIRLGGKRIVFLGLDLAFSDGYVHAENTSLRKLASEKNLLNTVDIYGGEVKTSKSLTLYRKWIEERIKRCKEIEFIDATEGGARIAGTRVEVLKNLLS